jgi:lysophospholipase L1-like esterase
MREDWDWADRMREVARRGLNSNRAGVVLTLGDSLSYANSSTRWARTATGASPGQMAVLKWSHAGEQNDRDGWWLAAVDRPENRSETAASGLRTDECLRGGRGGLPPLRDLVSRYRPQVAFVLLGANDASARRAPEVVAADMGAILDVLLDHGTVPVLQLLAPRADPAADDLSREYNRRFVELARARQIPLIDLRGEFLERAPQGAWRTQLLQPDGLHFSHERADGPPSAENLANCGYLLRCWLAVEKLAQIKACALDPISAPPGR